MERCQWYLVHRGQDLELQKLTCEAGFFVVKSYFIKTEADVQRGGKKKSCSRLIANCKLEPRSPEPYPALRRRLLSALLADITEFGLGKTDASFLKIYFY